MSKGYREGGKERGEWGRARDKKREVKGLRT